MQTVYCNLAALAVASLYYYWRAYAGTHFQQQRTLRERVAS